MLRLNRGAAVVGRKRHAFDPAAFDDLSTQAGCIADQDFIELGAPHLEAVVVVSPHRRYRRHVSATVARASYGACARGHRRGRLALGHRCGCVPSQAIERTARRFGSDAPDDRRRAASVRGARRSALARRSSSSTCDTRLGHPIDAARAPASSRGAKGRFPGWRERRRTRKAAAPRGLLRVRSAKIERPSGRRAISGSFPETTRSPR